MVLPPNATDKRRICLLVCRNFAKEFSAAAILEGIQDLDVSPFPSFCQSAGAKRNLPADFFQRLCTRYRRVIVVGGLCLRSFAARPDLQAISNLSFQIVEQCFYPLAGPSLVDFQLAQSAYLLTPDWLANWQKHLAHLGFATDDSRTFFAESCTRLVFLDTLLDSHSESDLSNLARHLALPFERIVLGLDFTRLFIRKITDSAFADERAAEWSATLHRMEQQLADYAMALDVMKNCTQLADEKAVASSIIRLFHQLFGAATVRFTLLSESSISGYELHCDETICSFTASSVDQPAPPDGFCISIHDEFETYGSLSFGQFAFPQYRNDYFNLALSLAGVCALSLAISRAHKRIALLNADLQRTVSTIAAQAQDLKQANQQLSIINGDLESFSYSVSHDLCAPLRNIDSFTRILQEYHSAALSEKGVYLLQRIQACAQKMNALIHDMLNLSRVGRTAMTPVALNISEMILSILADLQEAEPERVVNRQVEPDLSVFADPALLRIMLQNLLGNAWKFTAKTAAPHIEFGLQRLDDNDFFFIRDNGAGFDMQLADKLFAPFQRLHAASDFPGSGIGLATVLRVIRKHDGEIRVDAAPGRGATFFFRFPRVD